MEIKTSLLARNSFLNLITNLTYLGCGIVVMPIIIRYLGVERFGIFSLTWVVLGFLSVFDLGMGDAVTKLVAEAIGRKRRDDIPCFLWTAVIIQGALSLLCASALILITPFLVERALNVPPGLINQTKVIFQMVALSIPVVMLSTSFRGMLEAEQRYDLINAVNLPAGIATFILPLLGIFMKFGLTSMVLQLLILKSVVLFSWVFICARRFSLFKCRIYFHKEAAKHLFGFGWWVTISGLIFLAFLSIDRFFIGAFSTLSNVTYYTVPYEATVRLWTMPGSLLVILFPAFSFLYGEKAHGSSEAIFRRSTKFFIILLGLAVVIIIFFAQDILRVWLAGDFAQKSSFVFRVLLISLLLSCLANIPHSLIQGVGRPDIIARLYLAELFLYLPLAALMIKKWGINGAAIACAIRAALDMAASFFIACRLNKIGLLSFFKGPLLKAALNLTAFAFIGYFIMLLSSPWRAYGICLLTSAFLLLNWHIVLTHAERSWLAAKLLNRIKNAGIL